MGDLILKIYPAEDQAFFSFWYGHMLNDLMQPPLCGVDQSIARYIWNAAIASQPDIKESTAQAVEPVADERKAFESACADHGFDYDRVDALSPLAWEAWQWRATISAKSAEDADGALSSLIDQIRGACINPATWSELGEKLRSLESAADASEFAAKWIEAIQVQETRNDWHHHAGA